MLVITRKIGESILVGDNIKIVVLEVRRRQIRLGIESPPDMVVLREEVANVAPMKIGKQPITQ